MGFYRSYRVPIRFYRNYRVSITAFQKGQTFNKIRDSTTISGIFINSIRVLQDIERDSIRDILGYRLGLRAYSVRGLRVQDLRLQSYRVLGCFKNFQKAYRLPVLRVYNPKGPKDPIIRQSVLGQQLCKLGFWRVYDYWVQYLGPWGKGYRVSLCGIQVTQKRYRVCCRTSPVFYTVGIRLQGAYTVGTRAPWFQGIGFCRSFDAFSNLRLGSYRRPLLRESSKLKARDSERPER